MKRAVMIDIDLSRTYEPSRFQELATYLRKIERQLRSLGYEIIEKIPHSEREILEFRSSLNSIPYTRGGSRKIRMPVYTLQRNETPESAERQLLPSDLIGTAKIAHETYTKMGFEVELIRDTGYGDSGPHCKLNQIAFDFDHTDASIRRA